MGRPVLTGQILEVTVLGRVGGSRVMNVWHYKWGGPTPVIGDGDAIVAAAQAILQPDAALSILNLYRNYSNEAATWSHVRYQYITPSRYSGVYVDVGGGPGTEISTAMPSNVAAVAVLKTELAGPAGLGRKHFTGLSIGDISGSQIGAGLPAMLAPIINRMGQVIFTDGVALGSSLVPVIFHRENFALSEPWSEFEIMDTARVMRRRTLGVGE